jgi:hypothetical protein
VVMVGVSILGKALHNERSLLLLEIEFMSILVNQPYFLYDSTIHHCRQALQGRWLFSAHRSLRLSRRYNAHNRLSAAAPTMPTSEW